MPYWFSCFPKLVQLFPGLWHGLGTMGCPCTIGSCFGTLGSFPTEFEPKMIVSDVSWHSGNFSERLLEFGIPILLFEGVVHFVTQLPLSLGDGVCFLWDVLENSREDYSKLPLSTCSEGQYCLHENGRISHGGQHCFHGVGMLSRGGFFSWCFSEIAKIHRDKWWCFRELSGICRGRWWCFCEIPIIFRGRWWWFLEIFEFSLRR